MDLTIGGGVNEHGRNCFFVDGGIPYIVDCGVMRGARHPYPRLIPSQIRRAEYLFLTHAHMDHTGAFPWLLENGFHGTVIGSEKTLATIRGYRQTVTLREPRGIISFPDLLAHYGRSGHCVGAVWYQIQTVDGTALFSGDYCEDSCYAVDEIANITADLAVLDCAFGNLAYEANTQLRKLRSYAERHAGNGILLPVPENGRGIDILCALQGIPSPICCDERLLKLLRADLRDWLREDALRTLRALRLSPADAFDGNGVLLLCDAQLEGKESRETAEKILESGKVLLTGHTDEGTFAQALLVSSRADLIPCTAHNCLRQARRLTDRNAFKKIVYYHCAERIPI